VAQETVVKILRRVETVTICKEAIVEKTLLGLTLLTEIMFVLA